jgi:predicted Fe-S protein YdhL (DUF1289 family)
MTLIFKLLQLVIEIANWGKSNRQRKTILREIQNAAEAAKSKKLARAHKALRRAHLNNAKPNGLRKDDGYRRD